MIDAGTSNFGFESVRKIFLFMMVSVDGYFEGPNHDISWHNVDSEFVDFAILQLDEADTLIFGRRTYELMAGFWPSDQAIKADADTARRMNAYKKLVFSTSLKSVDWNNSELHKDHVSSVLKQLKNGAGKDIAVFGSSNLCLTLLSRGLLDEIRIMVNPVVLGAGTQLFDGIDSPLHLSLAKSKTFKSGNVLLTYVPGSNSQIGRGN
jgi:dihydrofolate reductase